MLVLTRKLMEKVYIGGDICVTVVRLEGSQVRLGIDAPRDIPVVRAELRREGAPDSLPGPKTPAPNTTGNLPKQEASGSSSGSDDATTTPTGARPNQQRDHMSSRLNDRRGRARYVR